MRLGPEHINFFGASHGGAIFSLADMALGLACNSSGSLAALIDAHMTFTAGAKEGEVLTATAVPVSRSRKLAVYRIDVSRADGTLVASLTGTVYLTGKKLGAD
jgi:acyl-CoA thioesterase